PYACARACERETAARKITKFVSDRTNSPACKGVSTAATPQPAVNFAGLGRIAAALICQLGPQAHACRTGFSYVCFGWKAASSRPKEMYGKSSHTSEPLFLLRLPR